VPYLVAIVIVVVLVVVTKGSFRRLGQIELRHLWILLVALAIQVVLEVVTLPADRIDDLGFGLLVLSFVLIFAFCLLNLRTSGFVVVAVGVALNALVIGLNHGMPTKDDVVERHGQEVHVPIEHTVKHKPSTGDDRLGFLGDQITLPGRPNEQFSIGDVVILLGVVDVCFQASRRPRRNGVALDVGEVTTSD
jgi:hypothetical protein